MATSFKERWEKLTPEQREEIEADLADAGYTRSDGSLAKTVEILQQQVSELLKEKSKRPTTSKKWWEDFWG